MNRRIFFAGFLSILLAACTLPTAKPVATITPAVTPSPTFTPRLIRTATPAPVTLTVKDKLINCRFGPGVTYELINELSQDESVQVVGRDEMSSWWYISDPGNPKGYCWVSADVTETHGPIEVLPVLQSPVTSVTSASLRIEPDRIVVSCHQFPQTVFLEAKVTSNGPTYVTWRWEASTGVSSNNAVLVFEQAGTQIINDYYQIGAPNDYWIKLHILAPNEMIEDVNFPVSCTP